MAEEYGNAGSLTEKNPLVSVIVPVYKVEQYLRKCVDSIIAQTYTNLEIILVDDGSPDNCPAICDEYAAKDNRVRVIHKENGGLSDARNVGIDVATGGWICFVDSDDVVNVDFVRLLLTSVEDNNCEIAICGYKCFSKIEKINIHVVPLASKIRIISPIEAFKNQYLSDVTKYVVAWNKIYKKELFSTDIRYPKGCLHEDDFTTYKLFLRANQIADTDTCLNYYRLREESITAKFSQKRIQDYISAHIESLEIIRNLNDLRFFAEALYVIYLSFLKLYGNDCFDKDKFTEIESELIKLKEYLTTKRRIKLGYIRIQMAFHGGLKNGCKRNNPDI